MWRGTVLLCLLIFYGHTLSQPVTDDGENVRQARQLDFGECCPCPVPGQGYSIPGDGMLALARDVDDCPCRSRSSDSDGASSMFFPTSTRSDGNFVRHGDKKEDFKPLLHPEVDLASSVLQTLRDATEEEYQDALARDAARSVAKAAEETLFGDTVPEASNGNIVTIIVNPKHTDSLDDGIPQETHVQESRCIHAPLETVNTNLSPMQVAQKPSNLLRDIFGLPKVNKPAGLSHRNLLDMDNGASNIQEHIEQVNDDQGTDTSALGLRKYAPLMKLDKEIKDKLTNMKSNIDSSLKKVPNFKIPSMKNKLNELVSNRPTLEGKNKTSSLPSIPKMSLSNTLLKAKGKSTEDLSLSASNIHEQAKKSFFQTKSHLENIFQHSKPVGLKTLLKLKDVEFVPLKDLIPKAVERPTLTRPKFSLPGIFNKRDKVLSSTKDKSLLNLARSTEIIEKVPRSGMDEFLDAEVSPSNTIKQIIDDNCINKAFKTTEIDGEGTESNIAVNEVIDAASSPSEIQEIFSDKSHDFANSQSNELSGNTDNLPDNINGLPGNIAELTNNTDQLFGNADDCNTKVVPDTETELFQSMEDSIENVVQGNTEDELNFEVSEEMTPENAKVEEVSESEIISNDEDCVTDVNDDDSITDSSNNINNVFKKTSDTNLGNIDDSLVNADPVTQEPCSQELPGVDTTLDIIQETKLIKPASSLDKTLSSIKEKIAKHIEDLKNPKSTSQILNSQTDSNIIENKRSSPIADTKLDSDCQNEVTIQLTTVKPDICDDVLNIEENKTDNDKVSMQDLQKLSDEMLQEEQERESKTLNCSELTQEVTDAKEPIESNSGASIDIEPSPNTQNEVVMDPQSVEDIGGKIENDVKNTCNSDLKLSKQSFEPESDANVAASEVIINRTPQSDDIISSPLLLNKVLQPNVNGFSLLKNPLPDIQNIKVAPLPTLDDIKLGIDNLFDTPARDAGEHLASEAVSMSETSNILSPIMSTDASAKHFQSLLPPLRLEDVDLDILQLSPQSNLFPKIPKLDFHAFRTKLPLPTDLRIKPIKLQSAFEDQSGLLGTLSLGQNNPWAIIPSLDDFGTQMKANTKKIKKTLRKPDSLVHSLKSSQGSIESKFRGATTKPVNLQTNDLLEAISRNHEDVNDKLRALHIDFNDRLETMRNNLFDTSIFGSGESHTTKSFSTFSTKNKDKKSQKILKPRKFEKQRDTRIGSSHGLQNKFKMPTAASVPVPKTIEVPKLKATLTKSPGLGTSGLNTIFQKKEVAQPKESTINLWKQASKKLPVTNTRLGKTINPFKDSKFKVSFSTTPRPTIPSRLQSIKLSTPSSLSLTSKLGKSPGRFGQRLDHSGSPSEVKHSIVSSPISSHLGKQNLENYGMESESRQTVNLEQSKMSKELQSWPKVSESAFLSKVKEAVKARMNKVNSPVTIKEAGNQSVGSSRSEHGKVLNTNTDMARSASTNSDVIEGQVLKENVSYKCTMVCTKD